ncbi:hypothetical protein EJ03DRAFT_173236 [Teratosphaeria nubilosa]|uniref:Uncharacterized protein n=1 Tax=Teratosphaeria nubilosa TaxID=161662 RepID=A0A6G1LJ32_9PEZI|nr:hypothetical protein EJ03DRAFT_173236 [Teratosphaeria nubilosa]
MQLLIKLPCKVVPHATSIAPTFLLWNFTIHLSSRDTALARMHEHAASDGVQLRRALRIMIMLCGPFTIEHDLHLAYSQQEEPSIADDCVEPSSRSFKSNMSFVLHTKHRHSGTTSMPPGVYYLSNGSISSSTGAGDQNTSVIARSSSPDPRLRLSRLQTKNENLLIPHCSPVLRQAR